ncbi:hypothetical protein MBLNU457_4594t1 [Dothideomycetes sp. NU457]
MAPLGTPREQWKRLEKKTKAESQKRASHMPERRTIPQVHTERPPVDRSRWPMFAGDQAKARHEQQTREDSAFAVASPTNNGPSKLALPKATTTVVNPAKRKASDMADRKPVDEQALKRAKLAVYKPGDKKVVWKGKEALKKAGARPAIEKHEGLTVVPFSMLDPELKKRVASARREGTKSQRFGK